MLFLLVLASACILGWVAAHARLRTARRERKIQEQTFQLLDEERRILKLIAQGAALKDVMDALVIALERITPDCLCTVLLFDEGKLHLREASGGRLPRDFVRAIESIEIGRDEFFFGTGDFLNRLSVVSDIAVDDRWPAGRDVPLSFGLQACWSAPIRNASGWVLGAIAMYHPTVRVPGQSDLRALESAAQLAGNAVVRLTAEQKLRETAERLRLAEDTAGFGVWELDRESMVFTISGGAAALLGLQPVAQRLSTGEVDLLIHPDDLEHARGGLSQVLRENDVYHLEFRIPLPDKSIRWCRSVGRAEPVSEGRSRVIGAWIDITEAKLMLDKLRESAERMRLAEDAASFGIWEVDLLTRTVRMSEGAAKLQGMKGPVAMSTEEATGAVHPEDRGLVIAAAQRAQETGHYFVEFRGVMPDGSVRWFRNQGRHEISPIQSPRATGAIIDITEHKETLLSLEKARVAAEAAARAKSEFLASMSHEIRTPLNGVIGMTGLLLDSELTEDQREHAETVRTSGEALLTIINDILDFSKIEAGKLNIESYSFDLRLVIEEVGEMLAPKAEGKNLDLVIRYPGGLPTHFLGDADRIRQVVTNLVGNAVKFTSQGHVLVSVDCKKESPSSAKVTVAVTDTGIGIPDEKLGILFHKFSQADSSITRRYGGTGLGLAICKQIVELMGGSINLDSKEGEGSTFWFELPLALDTQPPADPIPATVLKGLRVLIVDDIEVNRRVVHEQISSFGMRNGSYSSASEALAAIQRARAEGDPYDFVIADYQMPDIDGATLAAKIKADPLLSNVVFVMLTSIGDWREVKGLEGASVDACLVKPVRQSKLVRTLVDVWSKKRAIVDNSTSEELAALHHGISDRFAPSDLRVLVVEDNSVNQKVAVRLLQRVGARADVAGNGLEALAMLNALPYDFVFMDCQMPEMDGYETAARIRRMEGPNRNVKIIALTADAINGCRERCRAAGMDDFLSKPVQLNDFIEVLKDRLATPPPLQAIN